MKVSVIGAGNVGATAANVMMLKGFAEEVVLLDIKEGFAEGKALDMMQTAKMLHLRTHVIGVHGDLMVPLTRTATYHQTPVTELLDEPTLARIVKDTKAGGGTLTKMLGTSAWYAPGTAIAMNRHAVIPCITYLDGEYAAYNVCAAVPVQLGHKGIEKIITLELTEDEQKQFLASTEKSAKVNESLHDILGANA